MNSIWALSAGTCMSILTATACCAAAPAGGSGGTTAAAPQEIAVPFAHCACPALVGSGDRSAVAEVAFVSTSVAGPEVEQLGTLVDGSWPADPPEGTGSWALLGQGAATRLGVGLGDELVVVWTAMDGSLANDLRTVTGRITTGSPGIDERLVLTDIGDGMCCYQAVDESPVVRVLAPLGDSLVGIPVGGTREVLASTASATTFARMVALAPDDLHPIDSLYAHLVSGSGFDTGARGTGAIVGRTIASELGLELGDRIVLMGGEGGEIVSHLYRVSGVIEPETEAWARIAVFVEELPPPAITAPAR